MQNNRLLPKKNSPPSFSSQEPNQPRRLLPKKIPYLPSLPKNQISRHNRPLSLSLSFYPAPCSNKSTHSVLRHSALCSNKSTQILSLSQTKNLLVHMAFSGNLGVTTSGESQALQLRLSPTPSGAQPAFVLVIPGTGFETLPPLAIPTGVFRFLKFPELKSVGLGLTDVPFHGGWKLVEWRPTFGEPEWIRVEIDRICGKIEVEEESEAQTDLNLGVESTMPDTEPLVEVPDMMSTMIMEKEEDNFWVMTHVPVERMTANQAEGTGTPVFEEAKKEQEEMTVGTGEPVPDVDRSGETPDLMEIDPAVQTGGSIFAEKIEGAEGSPDLGAGEGDLRMEDFPQDIFERMGDLQSEEPPLTPPVSGSKQ